MTRPRDGSSRVISWTSSHSRRRSMFSDSSTTELRLSGLGRPTCLRPKASNCWVSSAARSGLADLIDLRSHCVRFGQLMVDEGAVAVDDREEIVEIVRHAAGESADALHLLGLNKALLRFAQRNLSLARPVSFAREPQGLPAGEHEHQCEDQRDADQADLSTPGIEERLYR